MSDVKREYESSSILGSAPGRVVKNKFLVNAG